MTIYNTLKSEYHWLTYIWPVSANLFEKNFSSHFLIRINLNILLGIKNEAIIPNSTSLKCQEFLLEKIYILTCIA